MWMLIGGVCVWSIPGSGTLWMPQALLKLYFYLQYAVICEVGKTKSAVFIYCFCPHTHTYSWYFFGTSVVTWLLKLYSFEFKYCQPELFLIIDIVFYVITNSFKTLLKWEFCELRFHASKKFKNLKKKSWSSNNYQPEEQLTDLFQQCQIKLLQTGNKDYVFNCTSY